MLASGLWIVASQEVQTAEGVPNMDLAVVQAGSTLQAFFFLRTIGSEGGTRVSLAGIALALLLLPFV